VAAAAIYLQFLLAAILIGIILLQGPKGEGLGAIGGSAKLFHGPRPRETLLTWITTGAAILFATTSTYLAFFAR